MTEKRTQRLLNTKQFVRNFLRINNSREFLIFLFFLFMSFVFWYLMTMTGEYEMKFSPKLRLKNLPKEVILIEPLPDHIDVVLRDKGDKLVEYRARGRFKELVVDFAQYSNVMGRTAIHGKELEKLVGGNLASTTQIVSLSLDTLQCYVASAKGVKVPVQVNGRVEANHQYRINRVSVYPDSVTVYAPSAYLDSLSAVYTPRVDYIDLTDSVNEVLTLGTQQRGIRYVPSDVVVSVAVSPYVTKTLEVPVTAYLFPYGMSLKTFPSKAKVAFRVSLEDYSLITEKDFALQVHYTQIQNNHSGKVELHPTVFSDKVYDVKVEPSEVDYLLELNVLPIPQ
jgi:hypothetical protein